MDEQQHIKIGQSSLKAWVLGKCGLFPLAARPVRYTADQFKECLTDLNDFPQIVLGCVL